MEQVFTVAEVAHIQLNVRDVEKSLAFYRMFDPKAGDTPDRARVALGPHTRLILRHEPDLGAKVTGSLNHFAVVLEGVPAELAGEITRSLSIPSIGIGAGVRCDGQVLVMHDLLGLTDWTPSFVKTYANLGALAAQAARAFAEEVAHGKFPDEAHSYR